MLLYLYDKGKPRLEAKTQVEDYRLEVDEYSKFQIIMLHLIMYTVN